MPIEDAIKELCPAVANAMMVGDKRKYNVMLITIKTVLDPETNVSTGKLFGDATRVDESVTTSEQVVAASKDPSSAWSKYLKEGFTQVNKRAVSNASKVSTCGWPWVGACVRGDQMVTSAIMLPLCRSKSSP